MSKRIMCPRCNGKGQACITKTYPDGASITWIDCPLCHGTGTYVLETITAGQLAEAEARGAFVTRPRRASPGCLFVDDPENSWWLEATPSVVGKHGWQDRVILCSVKECVKPATQLDHHYPYETQGNRCDEHKEPQP